MTLDSYERAYRRIDYRRCDGGDLEAWYEKVVLYEKDGLPCHAARQLPDGRWTSKCGKLQDINHARPETVSGSDGYGAPGLFMRRRVLPNRATAQELNIVP
jgi:hypothetical protein